MITVVGAGPSPIHEWVSRRIAGAHLVVGSRRLLAAAGAPGGFELTGDLSSALEAIEAAGGDAVVLASGDPGFFGIVRALASRFGRESLEVLPGLSSVAGVFARAGLPWDDALVVSAHGRDPRAAINACRAHPKVAVLTSPSFGPAELARSLSGLGRRLVVAEDLGSPGERVVEGTAGEIAAGSWRDPNVVAVFDESRAVGAAAARLWPGRQSPELWGLPEEEFFHRGGMITKAEVRALALARLGPGVGDLIWDVGAGSGSVAVDCARHGAAAIAVEADGCACRFIEANAARHQVFVEVVHGEAPEALDPLPDPDAAFVGGTGGRFEEVVKSVASRVRRGAVVALAAVERVAQAAALLESGALETEAVLVQAARLKPLGHAHRLEPINPVFLVSGRRS